MKIGIWQYFNEWGYLIREENHDERFGRFGYLDVLDFLKRKGYLGENNGGIENIGFTYTSDNRWETRVYTKNFTEVFTFTLDGETGEVLEEKFNYRWD